MAESWYRSLLCPQVILVIKPAGCHYFLSDPRLLSALRNINNQYQIAWWQRPKRVNNLPKVTTQRCPAASRTLDPSFASPTLYQLCHAPLPRIGTNASCSTQLSDARSDIESPSSQKAVLLHRNVHTRQLLIYGDLLSTVTEMMCLLLKLGLEGLIPEHWYSPASSDVACSINSSRPWSNTRLRAGRRPETRDQDTCGVGLQQISK